MKNLTLATALVVLAATFATSGFAADQKVEAKAQAVAEITFVNKAKKKRSPYVSPAIYRTDITGQKERAKNLLIDVSSRKLKKKFFKKKSFGHRNRGFGHRGFSGRGGGFGHSGFGHGGFHNDGFGHSGFGHGGFGLGTKLKKKLIFGK